MRPLPQQAAVTSEQGRRTLRAICEWWLRGGTGSPDAACRGGWSLSSHAQPLGDSPERDAVLCAHLLEFAAPGLHLWIARWLDDPLEPPACRAALCAARLLSARDQLLMLVMRRDSNGASAGALVDTETCARIAIAGYDVESELRLGNSQALLAAAGDLLELPPARARAPAPAQYLVLGLKP